MPCQTIAKNYLLLLDYTRRRLREDGGRVTSWLRARGGLLTLTYTIHPEVKKSVLKEYARLSIKFPHVSTEVRMDFAKTLVRDLALADSFLFMGQHAHE